MWRRACSSKLTPSKFTNGQDESDKPVTAKTRLLVSRRMPPNVTARACSSYAATLNEADAPLGRDGLLNAAQGQAGLLVCASEKMDAELIAQLPDSVRIISTFSVGYEHIDVAAALARGIVVTNTPDVLTDATADITMLCLLGAARRANEALAMVREGRWVGWDSTMLLGTHVTGKRLGIFGMGRIGRAVARRARGFGMQIHYLNRTQLPDELAQGAVFHADLDTFLGVSEFLCINAPASPETVKFLNAETITRLPDKAVIVNTARGNLIDDEALISALNSGKIAAAGLDVFDGEPRLTPEYTSLPNVFALPHVGSATHETRDAMGYMCLDNLDAFFAGRACANALSSS
jgi:lactate dehydrogenase-like 2-hydroxyacid dehydrogenase